MGEGVLDESIEVFREKFVSQSAVGFDGGAQWNQVIPESVGKQGVRVSEGRAEGFGRKEHAFGDLGIDQAVRCVPAAFGGMQRAHGGVFGPKEVHRFWLMMVC